MCKYGDAGPPGSGRRALPWLDYPMPDAFPPRLYVLVARDAPVACVLRHGPNGSWAGLRWDRGADSFTLGQWMRGHIYPERCDISDDGAHLLYFACNYADGASHLHDVWTAISRVPYFKALTLYPQCGTYGGGGAFLNAQRYLGPGGTPAFDHAPVRRKAKATLRSPFAWAQDPDWRLLSEPAIASPFRDGTWCYLKELPHGWELERLVHITRPDAPGRLYDGWYEHRLLPPAGRPREPHLDWTWADFLDGRLAWACDGRLWSAPITAAGPGAPDLLHDFHGMAFDAIAAPY